MAVSAGKITPVELELPDFVSTIAGTEPSADLIGSGPAAYRLLSRVGNEGTTRSLLATSFWRSWLASSLAPTKLAALGASSGILGRSRTIIVGRDQLGRFDLLVLDPTLPAEFAAKALDAEFGSATAEAIMFGALHAFRESPISLIERDAVQLAVEVASHPENHFSVILSREPAYERLSVPSSPLTVDNLLGTATSTVGANVEDVGKPGRVGVTAAFHGVGPASAVKVGGKAGTVVRSDTVTDSAFIEVSGLSVSTRPVKGAMSGMAPRGNQTAEFIGIISGQTSTVIHGWDAQIPNPSSLRQACVYTRRDAQPGDSGSALVTDDGWIVGFGFERTKPGESPSQCSWIWAESVLNRLNVKLI